jgi:hypothetical protein
MIIKNSKPRIFIHYYQKLVKLIHNEGQGFGTTAHFLVPGLVSNTDPYARKCSLRTILITLNEQVIGASLLIKSPGSERIAIGFFEAVAGQEQKVAQECLAAAREYAQELGLNIVIAGLNGHVSYGVGYLLDHFECAPAFDTPYNSPNYPRAWESLQPIKVHKFHSYKYNMSEFSFHPRIAARTSTLFKIRPADLNHWPEEVTLLTEILNENADFMPLYIKKEPADNVYLMQGLRYLLKPKHLLFAVDRHDKAVGFIFWHPDFNQSIPSNRWFNLAGVFIMSRLGAKRIKHFVMNTLAVSPKYHSSGIIFALCDAAAQLNSYPTGESGFISDQNRLSSALGSNVNGTRYKSYAVFEYAAEGH